MKLRVAIVALLLVGGYAALLALVRAAPAGELRVVLSERRAHATAAHSTPGAPFSRASVQGSGKLRLVLDGWRVLPRLDRLPAKLPAGLHTATWQVSHLGRGARRASRSFLVGPRLDPAKIPRAVRLVLPGALLDGEKGARAGTLAAVLEPILRRVLSRGLGKGALQRYFLGKLEGVDVSLAIDAKRQAVCAVLGARFVHGAKKGKPGERSALTFTLWLRPSVDGGRIKLARLGEVKPALTGRAARKVKGVGRVAAGALGGVLGHIGLKKGGAIVGAIAGLVAGSKAIDPMLDKLLRWGARRVLAAQLLVLERAIARFVGERARLSLPAPRLQLRLSPAALAVAPQSLALVFDVAITGPDHTEQGGARRRAWRPVRVSGPLGTVAEHIAAAARPAKVGSTAPRLDLSADLVNAVLFAAWRSRELDAMIRRSGALGPLSRPPLSELLSFRVGRFRFGLAPTLSAGRRPGAFELRAGRLGVALEPLVADPRLPRHVTLDGSLALVPTLDAKARAVRIAVKPTRLSITCGDGTPARPLRPCLDAFARLGQRMLARRDDLAITLPVGALYRSALVETIAGKVHARVTPRAVRLATRPYVSMWLSLELAARE